MAVATDQSGHARTKVTDDLM